MARQKKPPQNVTAQRQAAMAAVPYPTPPVRREVKQGKLYVTVHYLRPRWQRMLGAERTCDRTLGLDAYGRQVYETCDGQRSVQQIIGDFARQAHVSKPEAELAVTQFLRTLLSKGLVVMEMEKPSS